MRGFNAAAAAIAWLLASTVAAQFGLTTSSSSYTVNTGGGLIFTVSRTNGDITSLNYLSTEYQGTEKMTHINSGLGTSTVTAQTIGSAYIKLTVVSAGNPVTQYYIAKSGDASIYMGTTITGEVSPGELRFLARLRKAPLPTGVYQPVADITGGTAIEGSDVYSVDGQTRCKFFSSDRFIDDQVHGVAGAGGVSISLVMPGTAYETSSGGPFMRDINNQGTATNQELTFYMNSGHLRTEPWRMGFKGPYALVFSSEGVPQAGDRDMGFFEGLGIAEYVPQSGRGRVAGTVSGVSSKFQAVVAWSNADNQYWTYASASGSYTSPYMKPGTYTMRLYKQELLVKTQTVTVSVGGTTTSNIASAETNPAVFWRVGEFDGQPFEFRNGDKFLRMHPSDSRMSTWGGTYTVGASTPRDFPMALFAKTGGPATIKFTLPTTITYPTVLRVGTTLSFKTGRPAPTLNNGSWVGADPGAPVLIDSRGVTRGAYRGYGNEYTWTLPAGVLKAGENVLALGVFGSGDAGFLSANYIVDAVELQDPQGAAAATSSAVPVPAATSSTPAAAPSTSGTVAAYGQCGGVNWQLPTACVAGYKCQYANDYYSQCVPA